MRKQPVIIFVSLLLMGVVAAAAQTPSQLDRVNVIRDADNVRVEMTASGAVTPKVSKMDSPARVVIDLPETVMATGQNHIAVGAAGIKGVRIGMDGQAHPTTRIVVDLDKALAYDLTPGPAGKLVLTLHGNAAAQPKTVAAESSAPVTRPMSPFSPRVIDLRTAPKAIAPATKPAEKSSASPSDFVFVEPTYQAKTEVKSDVNNDAADVPVVRAQEAAARFSDKTAAELLPVSMHAAPQAQSASGPAQSSTGITPAVNLAAEQKAQMNQQGVAAGPRYTGEPISVNLKDVDLKDFFRLVHEISGLNVVLDPNVHGTLTIVLDDVPWDQALDIVSKGRKVKRNNKKEELKEERKTRGEKKKSRSKQ